MDRCNAEIKGSNSTRIMDYVRIFLCSAVLCG
jgi:hypothetical protein